MILPQMRTPDYDIELFTEDTPVQLLASPDSRKTMGEILKDPKTPVLAFTGTLYREIRYLVEQHKSTELAVFLTIKRLSALHPHWLAFDFFMPKQRISAAEVVMDAEDCERYFNELKNMDYFRENGLHKNIAHLHSHAQFGVFWSKTDDTEQFSREELGFHDDYRLFVVVNAKGDIKFSYVGYKPVLHRVDGATCVLYSCPEYAQELTKARKEELDKIAGAAMTRPAPAVSSYQYGQYGQYNRGGRLSYGTQFGKNTGYGHSNWDDFYGTGFHRPSGYWDPQTGEWTPSQPAAKPAATTTVTTPNTKQYTYNHAFETLRGCLKGEDNLFGDRYITEEEVHAFACGVVAREVTPSPVEKIAIREVMPLLYSECIRNMHGIDETNVSELAKTLGAYINGQLFVANNAVVLSEVFDDDINEIGYRLEHKTVIPIGEDMTDILLSEGFPTDPLALKDFLNAFALDLSQYSDNFFINDAEQEAVGA